MMKKRIRIILLVLVLAILAYGVHYAWTSFPIISGYSAKNACSCAFIQNRTKASIENEELKSFPLSLGSIRIDDKDSSVTGSVWGMAKRKAIFRAGFGCTLVNDVSEDELRRQRFPYPRNLQSSDTSDTFPVKVINNPKLSDAVSLAFAGKFNGRDVNTHALLIIENDSIIAERYSNGYDPDSKFLGWSMAKSVTSALIGILVKDGRLNVQAPAPVAGWETRNRNGKPILLQHLLQQTSGLDFGENYNKSSEVTNMLFNRGDMGGFAAARPQKDDPGTVFYYSSGNSNILSRIVRTTVGDADYYSFPYRALFYKLGMYHTLLEPDASGTFVGSSYIYASARDYARFGLLYLHDGIWNGERILPAGWVQQTITPPPANALKNYGFQFWLNGLDPDDHARPEFPEMPSDLFYADGYGGQRIYIVPSRSLVVVRIGLNKFDEHGFLKLLAEAVK